MVKLQILFDKIVLFHTKESLILKIGGNLTHHISRWKAIFTLLQAIPRSVHQANIAAISCKIGIGPFFCSETSMSAAKRKGANMIATAPLNLTHSHEIYHIWSLNSKISALAFVTFLRVSWSERKNGQRSWTGTVIPRCLEGRGINSDDMNNKPITTYETTDKRQSFNSICSGSIVANLSACLDSFQCSGSYGSKVYIVNGLSQIPPTEALVGRTQLTDL